MSADQVDTGAGLSAAQIATLALALFFKKSVKSASISVKI